MKKLILSLPLIMLLSGCYDFDPEFIDERLKPYVNQFYLEAESRGVVLSKNLWQRSEK